MSMSHPPHRTSPKKPRSRMLDRAKRAPKPDQGATRQKRTTKKNPANEPKRGGSEGNFLPMDFSGHMRSDETEGEAHRGQEESNARAIRRQGVHGHRSTQ